VVIWTYVKYPTPTWRGGTNNTQDQSREVDVIILMIMRWRLLGESQNGCMHLNVEMEKTKVNVESSISGTRRRKMVRLKW